MKPIVISEEAAWGCSGLAARDFRELVDALVDSGRMVRSGRLIVFPNLKTASLVLTSRPRRKGRL
ncbi:MAG: hypothetical protein ACYDBY_15215 [Thermoanaerobaculia bacterium]